MEFAKEINDDTPISGKYKTIGQVKNSPIKSTIQVISRMKPGEERKYLGKWLFETHCLRNMLRMKVFVMTRSQNTNAAIKPSQLHTVLGGIYIGI